jgi:hypothetical protein
VLEEVTDVAPTTDFRDAQRFAAAITACGGRIPQPLQHLLASYQILSTPTATARPEEAIVDAALNGSLTHEVLARLAPKAAAAANTAAYLADLSRRCESILLGQFHRSLVDDAADEIIASLKGNFDRHAKAIAHAKTLFDAESTPDQVLAGGQPGVIAAWQGLDEHIRVIAKIASVASQFGCRPKAQFPQITEYPQAENFKIDDRAVTCTDGPLVVESGLFNRPDAGHRSSPWFKTTLRLHTISEAQQRYNRWAADEFDRVHAGPRGGWLDENGQVHEHPRPANPYRREKVS